MKKIFISSLLSIFIFKASAVFAFALESSTFFTQDTLPTVFTCDGKNISPDLSWKDIPANTKSFVLILSDPDAPDGVFYHWVLFNLPATTNALTTGITTLPAGSITGKNSWGKQQYNGPCPPKGSQHRYIFSLYAINTMLDLPADSAAPAVLDAIQNHIMGNAELKVTFGH